MKTPIVTIVGRPNVGKSTIFNKIAGSRVAITTDEAGATRDRIFYKIENPEIDFFLVDTGGLEFGKGNTAIEDNMQLQARIAIEEADIILFVVDGKSRLIGEDYKVAELLRKKSGTKPVILVINKCDRFLDETELADVYELGLGDPTQVSALHRTGLDTLLDKIINKLKKRHFLTKKSDSYKKELRIEERHRNITLAGKPNVGKSSIINAILNKDKLIVSDIPGTTRDSTDSLVKFKGSEYNFIDTAGLKRPGKTKMGVEKFSAIRSAVSIERSDIVLFILDTSEPISHQDQQIANFILKAGKGLIIVANKWDIKDPDLDESERRIKYISNLKKKFPFLSWAPVVFTSAVTKKNFHHIFEQIEAVLAERKKRITTSKLNSFAEILINSHPPTGKTRTKPKIYYITQAETEPPRFIIFVNKKAAFHFSYLRYLENRIREKFGFMGTSIKLEYREKDIRD